jgi:hypothetical protein
MGSGSVFSLKCWIWIRIRINEIGSETVFFDTHRLFNFWGVFYNLYIFSGPHLLAPGANAARAEGLQQLLGGAEGGLHIVLQRVQEVRAMHEQALCRVQVHFHLAGRLYQPDTEGVGTAHSWLESFITR